MAPRWVAASFSAHATQSRDLFWSNLLRKTSGSVHMNVLFTVINKKKNQVDASLDKINAQIPTKVSDNRWGFCADQQPARRIPSCWRVEMWKVNQHLSRQRRTTRRLAQHIRQSLKNKLSSRWDQTVPAPPPPSANRCLWIMKETNIKTPRNTVTNKESGGRQQLWLFTFSGTRDTSSSKNRQTVHLVAYFSNKSNDNIKLSITSVYLSVLYFFCTVCAFARQTVSSERLYTHFLDLWLKIQAVVCLLEWTCHPTLSFWECSGWGKQFFGEMTLLEKSLNLVWHLY